jgi:hypothetical protein
MTETREQRLERHKHDGWIGVDLDGTLAFYDDWRGPSHIGAPVPAMLDRVKRWLDDGYDVRIFTARAGGPPREAAEATVLIWKWCETHIGRQLPVTAMKDYAMVELWDDRAVQVVPNTGRRADGAD